MKTIATLSKLIPQNILFILEYGNESKLAIYHTNNVQTDWKPTEEQRIELQGLNLIRFGKISWLLSVVLILSKAIR